MDVGNRAATKRIAIVGAGFSGTAVAAMLSRVTTQPLEITLFDKSGSFGAGDAYRTPYPWHILNVRARDMSAFEDQPAHFVEWVAARQQPFKEVDTTQPIGEQFLPRYVYHHYLRELLQKLQAGSHEKVSLKLVTAEVVDAEHTTDGVKITTRDNQQIDADKIVLAVGNHLPMQFPFPVRNMHSVLNPWDYAALEKIPVTADVMIVGTGLTMIDAVLTLHEQQHRGKIIAISRHGMLPQAHADSHVAYQADSEQINFDLRTLTKYLRQKSSQHMRQGGDWRSIINALRMHVPVIWESASVTDKKRFIRHIMPYWNVHRHRVHSKLMTILDEMVQRGQLRTLAGRVLKAENNKVQIRLRHNKDIQEINIDWLLNCMGPGMDARRTTSPLMQNLVTRGSIALDPLAIGFAATASGKLYTAAGQLSATHFTLGPPTKGVLWECTAVPEIRKQSYTLAKILVGE